jgi:ABC-type uncharacterized transport system substrate-binding protein
MKRITGVLMLILGLCLFTPASYGQEKTKIFVVSSYHREYLWSQDTNKGVCAALMDLGYLDNTDQAKTYTEHDYVESSTVIVKKTWMDTKRKSSKSEMADATRRVVNEINMFKPDIILLGDDNATNYVGNQYIDTDIPIVFWGVNGMPAKYGLLDTVERPGHNVTGIYQAGYLKECVEYLKRLVPGIKTMAVLSDDSETGRSKLKELEKLAMEGKLPVKIIDTVATNSLSEWKSAAQRFQREADAIFVVNHNTIKDEEGNPVDQMELGAWYLRNIKKPDCAHEKQFAQEGILLVVDDSGYKQGYEAVKVVHEILNEGKDTALIPARAPERGPIIVNKQRAEELGIELADKDFIEEYIEVSYALEKFPQAQ